LLSNFPMWVFENGDGSSRRPVLGVKLSSSIEKKQNQKISNAFDMFHALFSTMKLAHDARYISKTKQDNIIFIPIENIDTVNMHINDDQKNDLVNLGKQSADMFLKHWPK